MRNLDSGEVARVVEADAPNCDCSAARADGRDMARDHRASANRQVSMSAIDDEAVNEVTYLALAMLR